LCARARALRAHGYPRDRVRARRAAALPVTPPPAAVTGGESPPVGAELSVRVAGVGLLILACGPAWVSRSALATIPGDYDGGPLSHVAVAVPALALAVAIVYYGLQVWGAGAVWCGAAALLLPAA